MMLPEVVPGIGKVSLIVTDIYASVIVTEGGRSVGTAQADQVEPGMYHSEACWWIARVVVSRAEKRGAGIGTFMLKRLLETIASHPGGVRLLVVAPGGYSNESERQYRFYRKNGFVDSGDIGLLMQRVEKRSDDADRSR